MTPAELQIYAAAYADQQKQTAFLNASLIRTFVGTLLSGKHSPSYSQLFGTDDGVNTNTGKKHMTDSEMFNMVMALNKAFGGSVEIIGKEEK